MTAAAEGIGDAELMSEASRRGLTRTTVLRLGDGREDYALFVGKRLVAGLLEAGNVEYGEFALLAEALAQGLGQEAAATRTLDMCGLKELGVSYGWEDIERVFAEGRDTLLRETYVRGDRSVHEVHPYGRAVVNYEGVLFVIVESFEAGVAYLESGERSGVLVEVEAHDFGLNDGEDEILFLDGEGETLCAFDIAASRLWRTGADSKTR